MSSGCVAVIESVRACRLWKNDDFCNKFYLGLVLIGGYAVAAMVGGYTGLKDGNTQEGCKDVFISVLY